MLKRVGDVDVRRGRHLGDDRAGRWIRTRLGSLQAGDGRLGGLALGRRARALGEPPGGFQAPVRGQRDVRRETGGSGGEVGAWRLPRGGLKRVHTGLQQRHIGPQTVQLDAVAADNPHVPG